MNCSQFLSRYTDYRDGLVEPGEAGVMEEHLRSCRACDRYRTVLDGGAALLRTLPEPELGEDFGPRLRHRLYSVDEERVLTALQSGTPALTVLGIAILLATLAWVPVFRGAGRDMVLEPIVVDRAPRAPSAFRPVMLGSPGAYSTSSPEELAQGLWENTLLYEYSALSERYNQRARVRRAADYGR